MSRDTDADWVALRCRCFPLASTHCWAAVSEAKQWKGQANRGTSRRLPGGKVLLRQAPRPGRGIGHVPRYRYPRNTPKASLPGGRRTRGRGTSSKATAKVSQNDAQHPGNVPTGLASVKRPELEISIFQEEDPPQPLLALIPCPGPRLSGKAGKLRQKLELWTQSGHWKGLPRWSLRLDWCPASSLAQVISCPRLQLDVSFCFCFCVCDTDVVGSVLLRDDCAAK